VLVLAAVTAVIASSFLFRSAQEAKLALRSFFQSVVLNLAEAGVEEALYACNTNGFTTANGWTLVSGSTTDYSRTITGFDFQQATGAIYIRVDNAMSTTPIITAAGVASIPNQPKILKQLRVGATARRIWGNGIVGKNNITFDGTAEVDSYDSALGPYNSSTNRSDKATVATNTTVIVSGSAQIYGYVATGGSAPVVGVGGRIYGATSPASPAIDPSRVRTDFSTNLSDATAPTTTAVNLETVLGLPIGTDWPALSASLPRVGDLPGANGRYLYKITNLAVGGSEILRILGPVDLIVTGNATVSGSATLAVGGTGATNPSFNLYCPGTINIGGSGMVNNTDTPANTAIWGTKPSGGAAQSITIGGSGAYKGTVYAANGNVTVSGAGGLYGAVIGNAITVAGSGDVHYDVQLGLTLATGGPNPGIGAVRVSSWVELNSGPNSGNAFARDNRAPFTALF
jgi:hypothetical protein